MGRAIKALQGDFEAEECHGSCCQMFNMSK
jgi:hypothetical protein